MTTLGDRLKIARERKGYTQVYVRERTNINNKTLSGYEKGVSEPDAKTLSVLADLYEVSHKWLLTGKGTIDDDSVSNDNDYDPEFADFIRDVRVWYKNEPKTKEEKLRIMRKMFEVFKEN